MGLALVLFASSSARVARQVADMQSRGIEGAIVDWSGQSEGLGVTDAFTESTPAIGTGAISLFKAQAEASNGKFSFAVMEDQGVKACAADPSCDVTQQILSDIAFLATNFFSSPGYAREGGRPLLFFFSEDDYVGRYGKSIDWSVVRDKAQGNPLLIFENAGGLNHAATDGAYSWIEVVPFADYPGSDPHGTASYLPYFYRQAAQRSLMTWGSAYKGFDDGVVNGWGDGRRYNGQVCGKTWLDTFAVANANKPLYGVQLVTWDDYEEGTELETGIDNHLAVAATTSGSQLAWTVALADDAPSECKQAASGGWDVASTIHHFAVYASSDGENLSLVADGVPRDARSLDLTGKLPAAASKVVVYAVGQPSIRNQLSAIVSRP